MTTNFRHQGFLCLQPPGLMGVRASQSQFVVSAVGQAVQCCDDLGNSLTDARPRCGAQDQDCDPSLGEVLLIAQVLVRSDENMVAGIFRSAEKISILQCRPLAFVRRVDIVRMKMSA